jgi:NAD(P)H-nitrite reductase large subunit
VANPDFIICRCEEVTYGAIKKTVEEYQCSSREVKLRTRAAMGACGGRTCRFIVDQFIANLNGESSLPEEIPLSYRPPVRPIKFSTLGGEE